MWRQPYTIGPGIYGRGPGGDHDENFSAEVLPEHPETTVHAVLALFRVVAAGACRSPVQAADCTLPPGIS